MERRTNRDTSLSTEAGYYLEPGYIYFSRQPTTIRAVLGSCVAVCLWDPVQGVGGMNHYLYPSTRERRKATPKYGNVAIAALVRLMDEAGSVRTDLEAQIFGGAVGGKGSDERLGTRNVEVARRMLTRKGIAVVSEDTGGQRGRKVVFDLATGEVAVFKVQKIRDTDWVFADR